MTHKKSVCLSRLAHPPLLLALIGFVIGTSSVQGQSVLVPQPKLVEPGTGALLLKPGMRLLTGDSRAQAALDLEAGLASRGLRPTLAARGGNRLAIILTAENPENAKPALPAPAGLFWSAGCNHSEGYTLRITRGGVYLLGHDESGLYYGVQTLIQWLADLRLGAHELPCVHIEDWPDLPIRAMHLCLFRYADRRPDIAYLKGWLGLVAPRAKLNAVIIEVDDLLKYRTHPEMSRPGALTQAQMRDLIAYGRRRHLTMIPHLQCLTHQDSLFGFGHPELLLSPASGTYNPLVPRVLPILNDLMGELHGLFRSPFIHLGFDEVDEQALRQNPQTRSVAPVELYLKHLADAVAIAHQHGMRPMIWPDMLLRWARRQKPDTAVRIFSRVPSDVILCDWQYQSQIDVAALETCLRSGHEVWATGSAKYEALNLPRLAYAAHHRGIRALVGSTWNSFGPLTIPLEGRSVSSLLEAGEYGWTVPHSADAPLRIDAVELTRHLLHDLSP
ncbi:MAG: beta-N-acetylhexosaminidase [Chloroflexi bacterium]|nr:beta-N-acetylhexosaminidase [Chloroflexota bacterium]